MDRADQTSFRGIDVVAMEQGSLMMESAWVRRMIRMEVTRTFARAPSSISNNENLEVE